MRKAIIASAIAALAVGTGTASAAKFITSNDIANGTIQSHDIGKGEVTLSRLSPNVQAMLAKAGTPGKDGVTGTNGVNGTKGADGKNGVNGGKGEQGNQGDKGDPARTSALCRKASSPRTGAAISLTARFRSR